MIDSVKAATIQLITQNYPSPRFPERGAFVERLARQWEEMGNEVTILAPDTWATVVRSLGRSSREIETAGKEIIRPRYISAGNRSGGLIHRFRLTRRNFVRAAQKSPTPLSPADFYYGKFLFRGGEAALALGNRAGRPAFADLGESWSFLKLERRSRNDAMSILRDLSGVICVSPRLREEVIELGADPDRVLFAPNDVDRSRFHRIDRLYARRRLGLPADRFIAAFTGHFVERKGPLRVLKALERLHSGVGGVFLGRGEQIPAGEHVLFAGAVPNGEMPLWLGAADVFVLPTLGEGNCNAINEAIAVGLPIISSDISDIRGQVQPSFGVLVDPTDIDAIASALDGLYRDEERRRSMAEAAYQSVHGTDVQGRAETILRFMQTVGNSTRDEE